MNIVTRKAPWKNTSQGTRNNPDPRYHSKRWKAERKEWMEGETDGVSNRLCIECYKQGIRRATHTVDHNVRVKDGADFWDQSNWRGLCQHHHAVKSAKEAQL